VVVGVHGGLAAQGFVAAVELESAGKEYRTVPLISTKQYTDGIQLYATQYTFKTKQAKNCLCNYLNRLISTCKNLQHYKKMPKL
jgi:hypothetical protein